MIILIKWVNITPAEVVGMTQGVYDGSVIVVDKVTKQILSSYSSYF